MSTINSIRKKNSNNRQQAGVWAKTTIKCNRLATTKITKNTHTKASANRTHTLCSRDIKLKIRECAHEKYLLDNVLTMILHRIIHQPLLNTSESFSSPWTATNLHTLLCRGYACPICNRSMVGITRAWRMLYNALALTQMPEECNNFYVKVDFVTVCCLFCFSYLFL